MSHAIVGYQCHRSVFFRPPKEWSVTGRPTPNSHSFGAATVVLTGDVPAPTTRDQDKKRMAKRHTNQVGDLQSMFLHLEELVLANSGENEFEEVFKLLVAKLWDERCATTLFRAYPDQ